MCLLTERPPAGDVCTINAGAAGSLWLEILLFVMCLAEGAQVCITVIYRHQAEPERLPAADVLLQFPHISAGFISSNLLFFHAYIFFPLAE